MTSDFFLEEADAWRDEAWQIMWQRRDVKFFLLTKRPERVAEHLPYNWGDGWDNIFFNVTAENQRRADERIPILLELPFRHKGMRRRTLTSAPLIYHRHSAAPLRPLSVDRLPYHHRERQLGAVQPVARKRKDIVGLWRHSLSEARISGQ